MVRTRKKYLVLRSDRAGEADIVGVFSSGKKAKAAVAEDGRERQSVSYWMVVLPEDRHVSLRF